MAELLDALGPALLTGIVVGLITWGGIRTDLKWLRRDVDLAHARIDNVEEDVEELRERRTLRVPSRVRTVKRNRRNSRS